MWATNIRFYSVLCFRFIEIQLPYLYGHEDDCSTGKRNACHIISSYGDEKQEALGWKRFHCIYLYILF